MSLLLDATIKVSLIVLLGLAATALLRRQSAALRHWVLAAALLCAACVPLLSLVVPSWSVPLRMPAMATASIPQAQTGAVAGVSLPATQTDAGAGFSRPGRVVRPVSISDMSDAVMGVLIPIWLIGLTISLSILLVGFARLTWLAWWAIPIREGAWAEAAEDVSHAYGLLRSVRLLQSSHPTLLVTWGLFRPKVILPPAAHNWPDDRIRIVLCHELAHIKRCDWAAQMASQLIRSVCWFNPVVWVACRRLRQEGEQACDDLVLQQGIEGREYAWQLLNIVRAFRHHRGAWVPAAAMARPSSLEKRIGAMLDSRINRRPASRFTCAAVALALACVTIPIAAAQAGPAPGDDVTLAAGQQLQHDIDLDLQPVRLTTSTVWDASTGEKLAPRERVGWPDNWSCLEGHLGLCGPPSLLDEFERDLKDAGRMPLTVHPARQISRPSLQYPAALRNSGIEGEVVLDGRIGADGFLTNVRVSSAPHPALARAAIEAASGARWEPARVGGVLVEVPIRLYFDVHVK